MSAKKNFKNNLSLGYLAIAALFFIAASAFLMKFSGKSNSIGTVEGAGNGYDQYGYNDTARNFNGTGASWCQAKGLPANCMGIYSPDKLVMKWTADWDRGNLEGWTKPPYNKAWIDNEWNGMTKGGSGAVWHYKIKWIGKCGADYTPLPDGGYCIWGQFETVMDQGKDPNLGPGHIWYTKAIPSGYGTR